MRSIECKKLWPALFSGTLQRRASHLLFPDCGRKRFFFFLAPFSTARVSLGVWSGVALTVSADQAPGRLDLGGAGYRSRAKGGGALKVEEEGGMRGVGCQWGFLPGFGSKGECCPRQCCGETGLRRSVWLRKFAWLRGSSLPTTVPPGLLRLMFAIWRERAGPWISQGAR